MSRTTRRALGSALLAAGLAAVPAFVGGQSYVLGQLDYVLSLVLVAIGLNVVTGFAGQLSLGPGAIFAIGGYTAAVLANHWPRQVGLLPMSAAAVAAGAVAGLAMGIPALRIGGFYLGMVTLFFALLVPIVAGNLSLTGKSSGISLLGNPSFAQHPSGTALYELGVALVLAVAGTTFLLLHSRVGHRFLVLRTSEELSASLGASGYRTKLLAFALSALPSGLGGAFYVYSQQFISPGSVSTTLTIYLLAACVIGGFGTVLGPVVGGVLVLSLSQFLGGFAEYEGIIFGVLLVAFAIALPEGVLGVGGRGEGILPVLRQALPPRLAALLERGEPTVPSARAVGARTRAGAGGRATDAGPGLSVHDPAALAERARARRGGADGPLVLTGVRRSFGGVVALDGVDLEVAPGTVHGLIGSNGSGKTTLLNLVSGFHRPEAGEIRIGRTRLDTRGAEWAARLGVARTFQTPKLLSTETVLANVVAAAEVAHPASGLASFLRLPRGRRADRAARAEALELLGALGLEPVAEELAGRLPHGLRRLVELARALALRPRFLLLDEPAAGLNAPETARLGAALEAVRGAGVGVLLVEHNVPFVLGLADVVTVLHLGRRLAVGRPDEIRSREDVAQAFLGRGARSSPVPGREAEGRERAPG